MLLIHGFIFRFLFDYNYLLLIDLFLLSVGFITRWFYFHILWINIHHGMIVMIVA